CQKEDEASDSSQVQRGEGGANANGSKPSEAETLTHPCQPRNHVFPGRHFGKENFSGSFQPGWFDKWRWLNYSIETDSVFCFACLQAVQKILISSESDHGDKFFVGGDFPTGKNQLLNSVCTRNRLYTQRQSGNFTTDGKKCPGDFVPFDFLSWKEGIAIQRRHNGILYEFMLERTYNLPKERECVMRRDNWVSNTIQHEIISQFAHSVQRTIVSRASGSDGTTDISTAEQFACCLQYVDKDLETHYTTAETLFTCLKDILLRLNIPIAHLQGYCFDGAANMSGRLSGVQARLKEASPHSLYVHCCNHALDLVLQEVTREVNLIAEGLNFVQSVAVIIKESAKRKQLF
ncbi:hypothetical protein F7725_019141, partial [Dissostichus mawsoni]